LLIYFLYILFTWFSSSTHTQKLSRVFGLWQYKVKKMHILLIYFLYILFTWFSSSTHTQKLSRVFGLWQYKIEKMHIFFLIYFLYVLFTWFSLMAKTHTHKSCTKYSVCSRIKSRSCTSCRDDWYTSFSHGFYQLPELTHTKVVPSTPFVTE
jgi:hypothetical protein